VSSVLYANAHIVPGLDRVLTVARACGAELLVDAYHQVNVVPMSLERDGLADAFIVGGGYKYCQLGEGNCFLRVPPGTHLRPVLTGWFAEFDSLDAASSGVVTYARGAGAFAGATYDPASHYRAAAVFDFHAMHGLTPDRLREISLHQVDFLRTRSRRSMSIGRSRRPRTFPPSVVLAFSRSARRAHPSWCVPCVRKQFLPTLAATSSGWAPRRI